MQHSVPPAELVVEVPAGALRVRRHGPGGASLALAAPGLSGNAFAFELLGPALGARGGTLAALDLRGRGRSPAGARGTHGWENHARDVLAAATALGAGQFDFVGHSMGAFVGLTLANLAPERLRRLVLIDAVGVPDARAMPPIIAAVNRLGTVYRSADAFLEQVKGAGVVPWGPFWEAHYREDLVEVQGGVRQRASPDAVLEDLLYGSRQLGVRSLWRGVRVPALLVRAAVPFSPGADVVTPCDRDAFLAAVPQARAVEIPANHYGVMNHPLTAAAVAEFLQ